MAGFDADFTDAERRVLLDARARLKAKTPGVVWTTAQLDDLLRVDLDLLRMQIDYSEASAEDREYYRGMTNGVPQSFRHRNDASGASLTVGILGFFEER